MATRNPRFHDFWRQRAEPDPLAPSCAGGFDEVLSDLPLGDEVRYGEEQERLVLCTMIGDLRIWVPGLVGPKHCEHPDVFFKHLSE